MKDVVEALEPLLKLADVPAGPFVYTAAPEIICKDDDNHKKEEQKEHHRHMHKLKLPKNSAQSISNGLHWNSPKHHQHHHKRSLEN